VTEPFGVVNESLDAAFEGNQEAEDEIVERLFDEIGLEMGSSVKKEQRSRWAQHPDGLCYCLDPSDSGGCQRYQGIDAKSYRCGCRAFPRSSRGARINGQRMCE
jgi:hypothetical protein